MSATAGTGAMLCMSCGRPMLTSVQVGGQLYHEECTRGPGWQQPTYTPPPLPVRHYTVPMDDERVRQIVLQELIRLNLIVVRERG